MSARNQNIDVVRGVGMLLVIYGHALELFIYTNHGFNHFAFEAWRFIYSFHMPLFYFVSGLVVANFDTRPLRNVLIVALTFIFLTYGAQLLTLPLQASIMFGHGVPLGEIANRALMPLATASDFNLDVTWFLVSLAFVQILAWLYLRVGVLGKVSIWAVTIGLYLALYQASSHVFEMHTLAVGLTFFLVGRLVARHGVFGETKVRWLFYFLTTLTVAALFFIYPMNGGCFVAPHEICDPWLDTGEFAVNVYLARLGFVPLFLLGAALGIAAATSFATSIGGTPLGAAIAWVGRNTLALLMLNGAVHAFVQAMRAFMQPVLFEFLAVRPSVVQAIVWSVALTVAQLALLPFAKPAVDWLHARCKRMAEISLNRLPANFPTWLQ